MDPKKPKLSRAANRAKKRMFDIENRVLSRTMANMLTTPNVQNAASPAPLPVAPSIHKVQANDNSVSACASPAVSVSASVPVNSPIAIASESECVITSGKLKPSDPSTWPEKLSHTQIAFILDGGPPPGAVHLANFQFPKTKQRAFPVSAFSKKIAGGTSLARTWLVYSKASDAAFCFCCSLFNRGSSALSSANGTSDWHHLAEKLD